MFHIAHELLAQNKISFEIIRPLIEKTAIKIKHEKPVDAQTGPAIRNDRKVIDEHLKYLENNKDYREVYEIITKDIYKSQQNK